MKMNQMKPKRGKSKSEKIQKKIKQNKQKIKLKKEILCQYSATALMLTFIVLKKLRNIK